MLKRVNRLVRRGLTLLALGLTAVAGLPMIAAEQPDDILRTSSRLVAEEQRQMEVRRRLSAVTRRIDWLLGDLSANQLGPKGRADVVGKVNTALAALNDTRVPRAAEALMHARENLKQAIPHLETADKEITAIQAELVRLLKELGGSLDEEILLKKLRELIENEDFTRRQTVAWGKKLFLEPDAADVDRGRLSQAQNVLGERYGDFEILLIKVHADTSDPDAKRRFGAAKDSAMQSRPGDLIRNVVSQINAKTALEAVASQDQLLVALRAIEKILTDGQSADAIKKDLAEELKRILQDQRGLRAQTAKPDALKSSGSELAARQMDLKNDLARVTADSPLTSAQSAMQSASSQLSSGDQPGALQSQDAAIASLEAAAAAAAAPSTAAEGTSTAPGAMAPGGPPMPAPPGPPMPGGLPMPGEMTGLPEPAKDSPPEDMEISAKGESLTDVKGDAIKRTGATLSAMQQQQRAAAIQKYVQQIPPEFRKEVAEYYEVLSQ